MSDTMFYFLITMCCHGCIFSGLLAHFINKGLKKQREELLSSLESLKWKLVEESRSREVEAKRHITALTDHLQHVYSKHDEHVAAWHKALNLTEEHIDLGVEDL